MKYTSDSEVYRVLMCFQRDLKIVDPICTLIFAVIMTATTIGILRDIIWILLEGLNPHELYIHKLTG